MQLKGGEQSKKAGISLFFFVSESDKRQASTTKREGEEHQGLASRKPVGDVPSFTECQTSIPKLATEGDQKKVHVLVVAVGQATLL